MQPYIFPYIGYFQLLHCVDNFVIFDDVNFIKRGWINRNRILINGAPYLFTIPLEKASSNHLIKDITLAKTYDEWLKDFYKTLDRSYKKAPYFEVTSELIHNCFNIESKFLIDILTNSIKNLCQYLKINTKLSLSSSHPNTLKLKSELRVLDICKNLSSTNYINLPGGRELYNSRNFRKENIKLSFLQPMNISDKQWGGIPINSLSILDMLMFNSLNKVKILIRQYKVSSD
jgi:hypothetical protein